MPTTATTTTAANTPFTVGPAATDINGRLFGIMARASRTIGGTTFTSDAFERVTRTVVRFHNDTPINWPANVAGRTTQLWIAGGSSLNRGGVTTGVDVPGFPLLWNELSWRDPDQGGIQLMTLSGDIWYWVSWEVTATAYIHFVAGTTLNDATHGIREAEHGPLQWIWSTNTWSFMQLMYPLYPGASLYFSRPTAALNHPSGNYTFRNYETTSNQPRPRVTP
jgi:hypothetical protein